MTIRVRYQDGTERTWTVDDLDRRDDSPWIRLIAKGLPRDTAGYLSAHTVKDIEVVGP